MSDPLASPHCAKGAAVCVVERLRVRETPETGTVLGLLQRGETVTIWAVVENTLSEAPRPDDVLGLLQDDETITIWAVAGSWALVQSASGLTGWSSMEYLDVIGELQP